MPSTLQLALEARARWHLEIGYPPINQEALDQLDDDDYDGEYLGHVTCWKCGGEGIIVTCMDDLCRNGDHCIHGDGDEMCPLCEGDGSL